MIEDLQKQIEKMSKDYTLLLKTSEEALSEQMPILEKNCSNEQVTFIKESLKDARSGKLNVDDFAKTFSKLK